MTIKAFTVHQPYAQLLAIGAKQYETRPVPTKYRGKIAIHAGKSYDSMNTIFTETEWAGETWHKRHDAIILAFNQAGVYQRLAYGAIIGYADLVGRYPVEDIKNLAGTERLFGDWSAGRYAWEIANAHMITPLPYKGQLGLWNLKPEMIGGDS